MTGYCEGCDRALLSRGELDQHYRTCHGFRAQCQDENLLATHEQNMLEQEDRDRLLDDEL